MKRFKVKQPLYVMTRVGRSFKEMCPDRKYIGDFVLTGTFRRWKELHGAKEELK